MNMQTLAAIKFVTVRILICQKVLELNVSSTWGSRELRVKLTGRTCHNMLNAEWLALHGTAAYSAQQPSPSTYYQANIVVETVVVVTTLSWGK